MGKEKILIPLISKKENDSDFLDTAVENAHEVILLLVIDTAAVGGSFGFTTSEISQGNMLVEEIKNYLESQGKHVFEVMEWGNTETKITNIAKLKEVDKVVLKKHKAQFLKELEKTLKKAKIKVEII